ncbi:export protein [Geobacillus genomosp. 3]|uniref:Export protein n=1 Tax=Geobacillus genomosp. 3 TaxID=1921421 RepID=S6A0G6_GEOG3|nr:MMPL family transporter [Geobacillus genomosp. 3]AGT31126.1 export protein [Geobacillus genomosp. 3]
MNRWLHVLTDRVATKKGTGWTLIIWLAAVAILGAVAPSAKEYEVSSIETLPDEAQSMVAAKKADQYASTSDGVPAIFVFHSDDRPIAKDELQRLVGHIEQTHRDALEQVVPVASLPPQAMAGFVSEDGKTIVVPAVYRATMESKDIQTVNDEIRKWVKKESDVAIYITGPAGIAADTLALFSRADMVLMLSTVGLILVLLIVIYRSPLLALIPLVAAGLVYGVVMQLLGVLGKAGLVISKQTVSIMSILLFAAITDYSLFIFSRYREELKRHENKWQAMKWAMRETGLPVFFSGGTVLEAMLVLFFAKIGDYRNFAPTFALAMAVIMIASVTLLPALFTLFGRKAFWPNIPRAGESDEKGTSGFWQKIGRFVVEKPLLTVALIGLLLVVMAGHTTALRYEYDLIKSFPDDMPSRQGYELLEQHFAKGELAPTTVLFEGKAKVTPQQLEQLQNQLEKQPLVSEVRPTGTADEGRVATFTLTFRESPYDVKTIDAMEQIIDRKETIVKQSGLDGRLYFAGETAAKVDERALNKRDMIVIVSLETLLILLLLIGLTRSVKRSMYMMATILVSFAAALGVGIWLADWLFGIGAVSDRVPIYAFVFLVALGIDYNIMLISRFQEEWRTHSLHEAVKQAVAHTGGVISSAGLILAATFAVLMTQPVQLLFVFGFLVAIGILLDTFLIRGMLLPGLIVWLEKEREAPAEADGETV